MATLTIKRWRIGGAVTAFLGAACLLGGVISGTLWIMVLALPLVVLAMIFHSRAEAKERKKYAKKPRKTPDEKWVAKLVREAVENGVGAAARKLKRKYEERFVALEKQPRGEPPIPSDQVEQTVRNVVSAEVGPIVAEKLNDRLGPLIDELQALKAELVLRPKKRPARRKPPKYKKGSGGRGKRKPRAYRAKVPSVSPDEPMGEEGSFLDEDPIMEQSEGEEFLGQTEEPPVEGDLELDQGAPPSPDRHSDRKKRGR